MRRQHRYRRVLTVLAVAIATMGAVVAAPQAFASATDGPARDSTGSTRGLSAADRARMDAQAPYMDVYEKVKHLADAAPDAGLAGVRLDVSGKRVYVYWAGEVPGGLRDIRNSAAVNGISVVIQASAHSEKQLSDAANQLSRFAESTKTALRAELQVDGSALTVHSRGLGSARRHPAAAAPAQAGLLAAIDRVAARTGVRIDAEDTAGPEPRTTDRVADTSPFFAGAVTVSTWGGAQHACTSGFSMYASGAPTRFMMTAAHCTNYVDGVEVSNGNGSIRMGRSNFIGLLFGSDPRYDLGVIQLYSQYSNEGEMYLEPLAGPVAVAGLASGMPAGGNYCISAAFHVPDCNILTGNQTMFCDVPRPCVYEISYTSINGNTVGCEGDSGGPIYYWSGSRIIAAGIQSAGYVNPNTGCFANGLSEVVASAVNRYNISGLRLLTN